MSHDRSQGQWKVDFTENLASCGTVLIRFSEEADHRLNLAFVAGAAGSLEEQCLIAGEAAFAIQDQRRAIRPPFRRRPR